MKIGNKEIKHGLALAPMAGFTDLTFRRICSGMGAEYTVCEMISAKAVCFDNKKTLLLAKQEDGKNTAIQLFGSEPDIMAEATRRFCDGVWQKEKGISAPFAIDINMGCSMHKIVSNGEGSALMKDPALAGRIIRAVKDAANVPVTVKLRSGWDENSINAPEIAKTAEENGADAITVHARTREQFYTGKADLSVIKSTAEAVSVPVFGNGDILSAESAKKMLEETGCEGLMIGRGAIGNPFIFSELSAFFDNRKYTPPTPDMIADTAIFQLTEMVKEKGEAIAIPEARKHLSAYIYGRRGAAQAREEINRERDLNDMIGILRRVFSEE